MTTIVFIHGHGASGNSFNYIHSELREALDNNLKWKYFDYDSSEGFDNNLQRLNKALLFTLDDIILVGHSLGGLYGLHAANCLRDKVKALVTIATPFGGSDAAKMLGIMFPTQQIYKDIHTYAQPIISGSNIVLSCPITAIVTTKGHSQLMLAINDGVVTRDSMRARKDAEYIEVAATHHEIVLHKETVEIIKWVVEGVLETLEEV